MSELCQETGSAKSPLSVSEAVDWQLPSQRRVGPSESGPSTGQATGRLLAEEKRMHYKQKCFLGMWVLEISQAGGERVKSWGGISPRAEPGSCLACCVMLRKVFNLSGLCFMLWAVRHLG